MSAALDLVLSRLDEPRITGKDRWRCRCPACGEGNRSTLSVGVGDNGCVLLKCWKSGCSPDEIAASVGLSLEDLFPPRDATASPLARRRMLAAGQALALLEFETTLVYVAANNLANGHALMEEDRARLTAAACRVGELCDEVRQ